MMKWLWLKITDWLTGLMNAAFVLFFFGGIFVVLLAVAILVLGLMGLIAYLAVEVFLQYAVACIIGGLVLLFLYLAIWPDGWGEPVHRNFTQPNQPKAGWAITGVAP